MSTIRPSQDDYSQKAQAADNLSEKNIASGQKQDRQIDSKARIIDAALVSVGARDTTAKKNTNQPLRKKTERIREAAKIKSKKGSKNDYKDDFKYQPSENYIKKAALRLAESNYEFNAELLEEFRKSLAPGHDKSQHPQDILDLTIATFEDVSLADEALDFLLETTNQDPELQEKIQKAKNDLNLQYQEKILAGRNMGSIARKFARKGLGTPTELREMYRDIIEHPKTAHQLFDILYKEMTYEDLMTTIKFLQSSLGADLSKDVHSKSAPELIATVNEVKKLRTIKTAFSTFKNRISTMKSMFNNTIENFKKIINKK